MARARRRARTSAGQSDRNHGTRAHRRQVSATRSAGVASRQGAASRRICSSPENTRTCSARRRFSACKFASSVPVPAMTIFYSSHRQHKATRQTGRVLPGLAILSNAASARNLTSMRTRFGTSASSRVSPNPGPCLNCHASRRQATSRYWDSMRSASPSPTSLNVARSHVAVGRRPSERTGTASLNRWAKRSLGRRSFPRGDGNLVLTTWPRFRGAAAPTAPELPHVELRQQRQQIFSGQRSRRAAIA